MSQEDQTDLEHLLSDAAPAQERQPQRQPEPEPVEAERTGDDEPVPPTDEQQAVETEQDAQEPDNSGPMVPRKGLEQERKKRQDLEQQLADMQKQLQQLTAQPQQQQQPQYQQPEIPDPYEDPQGFFQYQQAETQRMLFENRAVMGQEMMRERYQDYDEVEGIFAKEAEAQPQLIQQMMQHPNPAKFAYDMGRKLKLMAEIGDDPTSYQTKLEQQILEKYGINPDAGSEAPAQAQQSQVKAPTSLAAVPSATNRQRDDRGRFAPASLSEILDD